MIAAWNRERLIAIILCHQPVAIIIVNGGMDGWLLTQTEEK